ncbi:PREDICTED: REF/SRPP-like protein At1g67360 [Tarenaya hassleriana]|uniref:REF/SRPP-like protein At1g67360 n=1 Tax=Tarenaya hassleriana TaxID=28532 RepID=UPI00053C9504|nr:PREDICTED: REF/SRPP-like protein At1g67360 [Tarenaya hassleriana]XP_010556151.1 PREDICTED: REF/SRPP-like protein At1g67360 [Tarenaya hassleriana]
METASKNKELELKHLGFVKIAAIQALVCVSNLYDYAKQNSGPLKSTVETVESAVTAAVGPVFDKFKDVPDSLLVFVDNKVDEALDKFEKHAPPLAKQVVSQANILIHKASEKAHNFAKEAQTGGVKAAFNYAATEYKNFLVTNSVRAWTKLNQYGPIHSVTDKALPVAAHLSEKYNHLIRDMSQKGYPIVGYLPSVPVDDIVRTYRNEETAPKKGDAAGDDVDATKSSSGSDSD